MQAELTTSSTITATRCARYRLQVSHQLCQGAPQILGLAEAAPGAAAGAAVTPSCMIVQPPMLTPSCWD